MLLDNFHEYFRALQLDRPQLLHKTCAIRSWQPASAAVNQKTIFVNDAKVAPGSHIVRTKLRIHAQGFQSPSTNLLLQGIEAEDGEVTGTTANRDARTGWDGHPQG